MSKYKRNLNPNIARRIAELRYTLWFSGYDEAYLVQMVFNWSSLKQIERYKRKKTSWKVLNLRISDSNITYYNRAETSIMPNG